jgi:hypothetical protein
MVANFRVSGDITASRLLHALQVEFNDFDVRWGSHFETGHNESIVIHELPAEIMSSGSSDPNLAELLSKLQRDYNLAVDEIESMKKRQHTLYSEFEVLRKKYKKQKSKTSSLLWSECTLFLPQLRQIPPIEGESFPESKSRVGNYDIFGEIGHGQYSSVKLCRRGDEEYAIKIIGKDSVASISVLKRISNEIKALQTLKGKYVTGIQDVIHTSSNLYLVLQKGGQDLFSFFDEHPQGVPEDIAKKVTFRLLSALNFCHERLYCHRDIKPEVCL